MPAHQFSTDDVFLPESCSGGEGMRVPLVCPQCEAKGFVQWSSLKNGIECPRCGCQFVITRDGRILAKNDLPHIRFACPRCGKSGAIPATISSKNAKCDSCKLPLALGPDQKFYGIKEATELRRAARQSSLRRAVREQFIERFLTNEGRVRWVALLLCIAIGCGALIGGGSVVWSLLDHSPAKMAHRFTVACLSGKRDIVRRYIEDDDIQRVELTRWQTLHFASILDRHRPPGDSVRIEVKPVEEDSSTQLFEVSLTSSFLGRRELRQYWYESDNRWLFDAKRTIRAQQQFSRPDRAVRARPSSSTNRR
jgi:hypothetical protein